jgi:hypothetical protein
MPRILGLSPNESIVADDLDLFVPILGLADMEIRRSAPCMDHVLQVTEGLVEVKIVQHSIEAASRSHL